MPKPPPPVHIDGVRVRPADSLNIADLISLGEEAKLSPWTHDDLLAEIKSLDGIVLKLLSGTNEIVGFVVGRLVPGKLTGSSDAELYNLAVSAPNRRIGLGQILLNTFIAECEDRCAAAIWLEVRESNAQAVKFYEKNGFVQVQVRKNFYRDPPEDALLIRLSLKNETA